MRKYRTRIPAAMVILALVLATLLGCASTAPTSNAPATNAPATTAPASSPTATAEPAPATPTTLKIVVQFRDTDLSPDNMAVHYIEEMTNTKLELTPNTGDDPEAKLNMQLAAGDKFDMIEYGTDGMEYTLVKAGVLFPINTAFDKAPNLAKARSEMVWKAMTHADGNIYAIPDKSITSEYGLMYRQDWLTKLNKKVPATLDEYYDVAVAMANGDPDGNTKKDTYAFGGRGSLKANFDHIFSACGTLTNYWVMKDGKVEHGAIQPGAKDALVFLNRLYQAGAIDPEFVTDDSDRYNEKQKRGIFGAYNNYIYILDDNNIYGYHDAFIANNPTGELVLGPALKGPDGGNFGIRVNISLRSWLKTSIMKDSANIDACLRLADWLASEEGVMFVNYGKLNEHYTLDNGVVKQTITADQQKELGINEFYLVMDERMNHTSLKFQQAIEALANAAVPSLTDGMLLDELDQYEGDLKDLVDTSFMRMITGETPIEPGFDEFVKTWKANGGDTMTEAVNKAYVAK